MGDSIVQYSRFNLAVSTFANALFLGQAAGIWLCGVAVDRVGFEPVFLTVGALLLAIGAAFGLLLGRRRTEP